VKNSDIMNFEQYLDSYLKFLRKFNEKTDNKTTVVKSNNRTEEVISNSTLISNNLNINNTDSDVKNTIIDDNTTYNPETPQKNSTIIDKAVENVTLVHSNSTIKERDSDFHTTNITEQPKVLNSNVTLSKNSTVEGNTTKIYTDKLNTSMTNANNETTTVLMNITNPNATQNELKVTNTSIKINKTHVTNATKPKKSKKRVASLTKKEEIKSNNTSTNSTGGENESTYSNIKSHESDHFEKEVKQQKDSVAEKIEEYENIELNLYKRIINISLSLIVIGLLMGVLLGLILVMYLNSKKQ
jgi:hypothetical protein